MAQDRPAEDLKTEVEGYTIHCTAEQHPPQLLGVQVEINPQPLPPREVEAYSFNLGGRPQLSAVHVEINPQPLPPEFEFDAQDLQ